MTRMYEYRTTHSVSMRLDQYWQTVSEITKVAASIQILLFPLFEQLKVFADQVLIIGGEFGEIRII